MLERAMRLSAAANGHVVKIEGDGYRAVAAHGESDFVQWVLQRGTVPLGHPDALVHRMVRGEQIVHIADSTDTDGYRSSAAVREIVDRNRARTTLGVALRKDGVLLGAIVVYRREVRPFTDKQIALLQNFAAQAVIGMDNARLLTETREALEQQTATAQILRVISSSPTDVQPTFDAIAAAATTLTDAALSGVVTYDGRLMHLAALSGFTPVEVEKLRGLWPLRADRGTATGRAILTRQVVHIEDLAADPERG